MPPTMEPVEAHDEEQIVAESNLQQEAIEDEGNLE